MFANYRVKIYGHKLIIQIFLLLSMGIFANNNVWAFSNTDGLQEYQKKLFPEHKQKLADDITRYRNADNLWDVLREEFSLVHYEENYAVQAKIEWFMNNQDFLLRSATRAAPYLYYISQQLRTKHLPAELVLLPIIESGYNPFSVSNMGASGIWQLMPGTASGLGIKRDWWYDGRRDVLASTEAALSYLAYLQSFFEGNWLLAIAAYNTGEGNVLTAIKKNIREGLDTDFWSLPVAQQTRDYVPSLLALAVIISHPDKYPIYLPPIRNAPYLAQVDVGTQINLKYAALLAGISHQKLMQLNPGFKSSPTSTQGPYKLVLPIENIEQFTENLARSPLNRSVNWMHYKVKSGDTLLSLARKFSTTTNDIRKMNHLTKTALLPGTNLLIPHEGAIISDETNVDSFPIKEFLAKNTEVSKPHQLANKTKMAAKQIIKIIDSHAPTFSLKPGDTIYMVRAHDTLQSISQHFHISTHVLKTANKLAKENLKPGKQLLIPTHLSQLAQKKSTVLPPKKIKPGDTIYMVRRGDTIEKIARKFRTTASVIRVTNLVDNNSLSEGDRLVVPTHMRS